MQRVYTLDYPFYFLNDPFHGGFLCNEIDGHKAFVVADTRELAAELFRKFYPNTLRIAGGLLPVGNDQALLKHLQGLLAIQGKTNAEHLALETTTGVEKLYIPTLVAHIEERIRGARPVSAIN